MTAAAAGPEFSLTPADFRSAYSLPKTGAAHQTIAIISAYDDPAAQTDLTAYTKRFGIPACTTANRCFRKLNQTGAASPLPQTDPSGGTFLTESSVGAELARGVCQSCSILLVEANSADKPDVSAAVSTAANAGATVIVTSFNEGESPGDPAYDSDYTPRNAVVVSASGDSGHTGLIYFPASLPGVLAVGGTQLDLTGSGSYQGETAWYSTTSGCSLYNPAAVWQGALAASAGCAGKRADVDLAAVAQPGALVHVRDAGAPCGTAWCEADGTSVAAPIIAGVIGLAGSAGSAEPRMLYGHARSDPQAFHDIRSGADSVVCKGARICQARTGWDGPTGLGAPDGLAAFEPSGGALDPSHPGLTVTPSHGRLNASRTWTTKLTLANTNPVAVTGSLTLSGRLPAEGGLRTVKLAVRSFKLAPLATGAQTLTIAAGDRATLRQLGSAPVTVSVSLRGPAGRTVKLTRSLRLYAP
ncbi:MAG: S53 family peptidase [Solirubrobacteraceae bacterium]